MDLRDAIQKVAVEWPAYGRPRVTRELRERGWTVNPKRVHRLMREDNPLCVRKRRFVVATDSNHTRKVYPNLARDMVPTAINQLWRADITYIRLRDEFVFLAVILDAYSRRVIGWALDRMMEDSLTLTALRMALSRRAVGARPRASFRSSISFERACYSRRIERECSLPFVRFSRRGCRDSSGRLNYSIGNKKRSSAGS
jgi:putative transposase